MLDKPPYIADQGLLILDKERVQGDLREAIRPAHFRDMRQAHGRAERKAGGSPGGQVWKPLARDEWLTGACDGRFGRVVLVTDAGMGKTTTLQWLCHELNRQNPRTVTILMQVAELPAEWNGILDCVTQEFRRNLGGGRLGQEDAERLLRRLCEQGRLVLLFDALDQASDSKVDTLNKVLGIRDVRGMPLFPRVMVAGRPYMIARHLEENYPEFLFRDQRAWEYLQLEDFNDRQQRYYLGDERYNTIPRGARPILGAPRVLKYLREVPTTEFSDIRTPSDVYFRATQKLLDAGINGSSAAQGLTAQTARLLLAAIAFEMSVVRRNFDGVTKDEILEGLAKRCRPHAANCQFPGLETALDCLAAMNTFLDHGLLEAGCPDTFFFRDRSLQEFYAGLWLAAFSSESDVEDLWGRIIGNRGASDVWHRHRDEWQDGEWYWTYRFAAEMPAGQGGRRPEPWIRAMAPLYRPGDGTPQGTRRWNEMLYRSWGVMQEYAAAKQNPAKAVIAGFQGEFQQILHLHPCRCLWQALAAPCRLLLLARLRLFLWPFRSWDLSAERKAIFAQPSVVKAIARLEKMRVAKRFLREFRTIPPGGQEGQPIVSLMGSPENEQRRSDNETQHEVVLPGAQVAYFPVTNIQYELFDPLHAATRYAYRYRYNPHDDARVVWVNWYDAWAFCAWLGIDSNGSYYRLPTEAEWVDACRASSVGEYFFGNDAWELDSFAKEPKGAGVVGRLVLHDVYGNVWEWCGDAYGVEAGEVERVMRGGHWRFDPEDCRSEFRTTMGDTREPFLGFRVALVPSEWAKAGGAGGE